jgi:N-acetylglucosamine malate deacetylase 1
MVKLLVVSPHPDDETLGAGGTILKYKAAGHQVYWLNVTNLEDSHPYASKRNEQIEQIKKLYRFDGFYNLNLKPTHLDTYPLGDIVQSISKIINEIMPDIVIVPYRYDVHSDHKIVFDSVFACTKSFRYPSIRKILTMEIQSETDYANSDYGFIPNYFIDISKTLEEKIEIMKIYESEIGDHPFPRNLDSIRALALNRGASIGVKYAEAFRLIKGIEIDL